jgi:hypothetical protein
MPVCESAANVSGPKEKNLFRKGTARGSQKRTGAKESTMAEHSEVRAAGYARTSPREEDHNMEAQLVAMRQYAEEKVGL